MSYIIKNYLRKDYCFSYFVFNTKSDFVSGHLFLNVDNYSICTRGHTGYLIQNNLALEKSLKRLHLFEKETFMRNKKKQIIFFLICIVFILGGLFTGIYWMTHIDQFKKNSASVGSVVTYTKSVM